MAAPTHTDQVVASYAARLPIRGEYEPQRGISRARNRAVDAAKGEYIVWTDDDTVVDRGWLTTYIDAFRRWPESALFGGPIIPRYESPMVEWLQACEHLLGDVYAARNFGMPRFASREKKGLLLTEQISQCALRNSAASLRSQLGQGPRP